MAKVKIDGLDKFVANLRRMAAKSKRDDDASVVVGYRGVDYAVYVHEAPPGTHFRKPGTQSKFLEQPARTMIPTFNNLITTAVKNGAPLRKALLIAGYRLQREAQQLTPYRIGNLFRSAFTKPEK